MKRNSNPINAFVTVGSRYREQSGLRKRQQLSAVRAYFITSAYFNRLIERACILSALLSIRPFQKLSWYSSSFAVVVVLFLFHVLTLA